MHTPLIDSIPPTKHMHHFIYIILNLKHMCAGLLILYQPTNTYARTSIDFISAVNTYAPSHETHMHALLLILYQPWNTYAPSHKTHTHRSTNFISTIKYIWTPFYLFYINIKTHMYHSIDCISTLKHIRTQFYLYINNKTNMCHYNNLVTVIW